MIHFRLYLDEDAMRSALAIALREAGVDVLTALEADTLGYTDEDQLIFAREQGRVLYSFNVGDFCRLHSLFVAEGRSHAGIILVTRQGYSIGQQLRGILNLLKSQSAEEMINQVVYLSNFMD